MNMVLPQLTTLFLCGDVMTGRGIDQILPVSAPPRLYEPYVHDARCYVELAEQRNGSIPRQADLNYVWGDALEELRKRPPDVKIINLETSITSGGEPWPGKMIHYRMHPDNTPLLIAAGIDVCALANNHILDWGYDGLADTLETLLQARLQTAGAGHNSTGSNIPSVVEVPDRGRVIVFSFGCSSSGIPGDWAARADRPGVNFLPKLSKDVVDRIATEVGKVKRPGDLLVASIHWGGNWGYEIPPDQQRFARQLIDRAGVDLVHGHSSHHAKGIEVYREKLILYGCGDLITDYEGITGYETFRGDLGLLYFARFDRQTGRLVKLELVPMRMCRFRLERVSHEDGNWLAKVLNREGALLGTGVELQEDGSLSLCWNEA